MSVTTFDYATWQLAYPEFGAVSQATAQEYFQVALGSFDQTGWASRLNYTPGQQGAMLVNLLVSHVAKLFQPTADGAPNPIVGRVSSASEGSVNVSAELDTPAAAAWFYQTQYGLTFWNMTKQYRTFRYHPSPRRFGGFGYRGF